MTNLENIKNIKSVVQNDQITQKKVQKEKKSDESFGNMVHDYLLKVSSDQKNAAEETKKVLADKSENVHDAMVALEEAGLSFRMLLEIRNRMLESYNEIKRTPV